MFFALILMIAGCDVTDTDLLDTDEPDLVSTWTAEQPCGCLFTASQTLICCDGGVCVGPLPLLTLLPDPPPHDVIDPECPAD